MKSNKGLKQLKNAYTRHLRIFIFVCWDKLMLEIRVLAKNDCWPWPGDRSDKNIAYNMETGINLH